MRDVKQRQYVLAIIAILIAFLFVGSNAANRPTFLKKSETRQSELLTKIAAYSAAAAAGGNNQTPASTTPQRSQYDIVSELAGTCGVSLTQVTPKGNIDARRESTAYRMSAEAPLANIMAFITAIERDQSIIAIENLKIIPKDVSAVRLEIEFS